MAPKLRSLSMPRDDLAWEENDKETDTWERSLHKAGLYRAIANLIKKYRPSEAVELIGRSEGYNIFYRSEYKDGSSAAMRIASVRNLAYGIIRFPEEKVRYEVATIRCIAASITIPMPKIYHFGTAAENPTGLGPFIIMDYIEHERTMSEALKDPALEPEERHVLDPNISAQMLKFLYGQMVNILLQLSTVTFPRIGSLDENKNGPFSVSGRPLVQGMNSLLDLFRQLASKGRLTSEAEPKEDGNNPSVFPLFSSYLRPSNVLIDKDLRVVGVIDWKFVCAAQAQFSFDPPWWLLLKSPEDWPTGYIHWIETYEPRLETFLRVLEDEEKYMQASSEIGNGLANLSLSSDRSVAFSQRMRESWQRKTWMINYAARSSWEFDVIFWRFWDAMYFGPNEEADHRARLGLLIRNEIEAMEPLVKTKWRRSRNGSWPLETLA
ncbi:phosphotransferase family protein [Xylaria acuta]|nr:phosphotransferase family protein [Xylaria acuta]